MTEKEKEENHIKLKEEDTGSTFKMPSGAKSKKKTSNISVAPEKELIKVSYIFPNGDRYEGECTKSASGAIVRTGTGKHTSLNGIVYTGEWQEDKINGKGTLQLPSGAQYEGQFNDNMYHGTGTYTFPDGSIYKGQFCNNRLEGEGVFTNTKGLVWTGKFEGESAMGLKLLHIS